MSTLKTMDKNWSQTQHTQVNTIMIQAIIMILITTIPTTTMVPVITMIITLQAITETATIPTIVQAIIMETLISLFTLLLQMSD
jgi:hypothetical protein